MRAGYRTEQADDDVEGGTGSEAVGKQGDGHVAAGQRLAHDAGAGDGEQQQGRAEELRGDLSLHAHLARAAASFRPAA